MDGISPGERMRTAAKMHDAAKLDDLIRQSGWTDDEFAERVGRQPSEVASWLSGTFDFYNDKSAKAAVAGQFSNF